MPTLALRAVCLCKSRLPAGKLLYYIPLLILLTANLWYGLRMNQPLPCIVTHSVFNALSAFANEADMTPRRQIVSALLLTVIAGGYALYLALAVRQEPGDGGKNL